MLQSKVTMNVRRVSPTVSVVDIQGELNGFAEDVLMTSYQTASEGGVRTILLNFSEVSYMNSSGIGLLVTLLIRVNRQAQRLMVSGLTDHLRHIFELTRLDEAMNMYRTEAEALAAAGQ